MVCACFPPPRPSSSARSLHAQAASSAYCLCWTNKFNCFNDCYALPSNFESECKDTACSTDQCKVVNGALGRSVSLGLAALVVGASLMAALRVGV